MKLSLACIAGNEESIIGRFLDSFGPSFDEIILVRATGNEPPDQTLAMARCRDCKTAIYSNAQAWPHVDNFAAARNQAFDMATGDWVMWADIDDLLSDSAKQVLARIRGGDCPDADAIQAPYVVDAQGAFADRIRIIRNGAGRWINAVHEDLQLNEGAKVAYSPELQIIHAPATNKRASTERNRRILEGIPVDQRTGREWWFLSRECEIAGDVPAAIQACVMATGLPDLGEQEKFAAYLTIGRWLKTEEDFERPLLEALRIDPYRREAFAELSRTHLARGNPAKALSYARLMEAIPEPKDRNWTHDASLYGWAGHDIVCHAESANGIDTTRRRKSWAKQHGIRISVIHPTCRPEQALRVRKIWMERATKPQNIEYIFGINEADEHGPIVHYPHAMSPAVPAGFSSAVANYNAAAAAANASIIIAAQDDIYPPHGWDEGVCQLLGPHITQPKVLHVHDGFREDGIMVIMTVTRAWMRKHGTLLCPEYDGYYSDTEYSYRAYREGEVIDGRQLRFYHDHPAFTGAKSDEGYMRQQNPVAFARAKAIFERRNPEAKDW